MSEMRDKLIYMQMGGIETTMKRAMIRAALENDRMITADLARRRIFAAAYSYIVYLIDAKRVRRFALNRFLCNIYLQFTPAIARIAAETLFDEYAKQRVEVAREESKKRKMTEMRERIREAILMKCAAMTFFSRAKEDSAQV